MGRADFLKSYMGKPGYKFKLVKPGRQLQEWTGVFPTREAAMIWHDKYGKWHKDRGHDLILVKTKQNKNENV